MKKNLATYLCALSCALGASISNAKMPEILESIAAIVGSEIVLQSEVDEMVGLSMKGRENGDVSVAKQLRSEVLGQLIKKKLLEQEYVKLGISVGDDELKQTIEGVRVQYGLSQSQFERELLRQGLSLEQYREQMRSQLSKMRLVKKKIENQVQIGEQDIRDEFEKRFEHEKTGFNVSLQQVLFEASKSSSRGQKQRARARAHNVASKIKNKDDYFSLAAKLAGEDGVSILNIGEISKTDLMPEFSAKVFSAEPGSVVGPIESPLGWHVVLVEKRVPLARTKFEDQKEKIRAVLLDQEIRSLLERYVDGLKNSAYIRIINSNKG